MDNQYLTDELLKDLLSVGDLDLISAGKQSRMEYLQQSPVKSGYDAIDKVTDGGFEQGNFYLFLGSAKNGKSTVLRCIGNSMAQRGIPVLYFNFEQPGKNIYSKLYSLMFGKDFRNHIREEPSIADHNIRSMPNVPFYISFWTDKLDDKSFNLVLKDKLLDSVKRIEEKHKKKPVVIIENLSDIYNSRLHGGDSLVNIVTQTAQDIKNFAVKHDIIILLAHHTGKLMGEEPTLDDVRDSKRVCDVAHSIFASYVKIVSIKEISVNEFKLVQSYTENSYRLKYIAGRGSSESRKWIVKVHGLNMNLEPLIEQPELNNKYKRGL